MKKMISIKFDEDDFKGLLEEKKKSGLTWREFVMQLHPDAERGDYLLTLTELKSVFGEGNRYPFDFTIVVDIDWIQSFVKEHPEYSNLIAEERIKSVKHIGVVTITYRGIDNAVRAFLRDALSFVENNLGEFKKWEEDMAKIKVDIS